jgi:hypothetical protein
MSPAPCVSGPSEDPGVIRPAINSFLRSAGELCLYRRAVLSMAKMQRPRCSLVVASPEHSVVVYILDKSISIVGIIAQTIP